MKKAFTLVEMLIVVVVLVILMSITFKLTKVYGDQVARNKTINVMQRLENCLSGYYAAFGSYPPVRLYASQNPYLEYSTRNNTYRQTDNVLSRFNSDSVKAACKAQPVAARFPYNKDQIGEVNGQSANFVKNMRKKGKDVPGYTAPQSPNDFVGWDDEGEWPATQIFQFGLMSYLLPRYELMAVNLDSQMVRALDRCQQWNLNNRLAANQDTGELFKSWFHELDISGANGTPKNRQLSLIARIPSQAVCMRWLPNLEVDPAAGLGYVATQFTTAFSGIVVSKSKNLSGAQYTLNADNLDLELFRGKGGNLYPLNAATVFDGWSNELYYHSEPPYQSYQLWSGGQNGETFPPWYPLEKSNPQYKEAMRWMADDIIHMHTGT